LVWSGSDSAFDPGLWRERATPAFEGAPPTEIIGQVLGGDAVEAVEPLLKTAVIGVDVVDVRLRCRGCRLAFPAPAWAEEGTPGSAGESGDRLPAIADEMIARRDVLMHAFYPRRRRFCTRRGGRRSSSSDS
jgi:hypothetical protein